jgi:hypothetical protein
MKKRALLLKRPKLFYKICQPSLPRAFLGQMHVLACAFRVKYDQIMGSGIVLYRGLFFEGRLRYKKNPKSMKEKIKSQEGYST